MIQQQNEKKKFNICYVFTLLFLTAYVFVTRQKDNENIVGRLDA